MEIDTSEKKYVVVVQCDQVVSHTCAGFLCEHAFTGRIDSFARYPKEQQLRYNAISCGGCCGRAVHRKLINLKKNLLKREKTPSSAIVVHLSTCMTRGNYHGPRCPHVDYIRGQVEKAGLDFFEDTRLSPTAEKRRKEGKYSS